MRGHTCLRTGRNAGRDRRNRNGPSARRRSARSATAAVGRLPGTDSVAASRLLGPPPDRGRSYDRGASYCPCPVKRPTEPCANEPWGNVSRVPDITPAEPQRSGYQLRKQQSRATSTTPNTRRSGTRPRRTPPACPTETGSQPSTRAGHGCSSCRGHRRSLARASRGVDPGSSSSGSSYATGMSMRSTGCPRSGRSSKYSGSAPKGIQAPSRCPTTTHWPGMSPDRLRLGRPTAWPRHGLDISHHGGTRSRRGDETRALPEQVVVARPTGVGRALATYDVPIDGRDEWLAAARRLA